MIFMSIPLSVSLTYRGGRNNIRVWYHSLGPSPPITCVFMCLCWWQRGQWWTLGIWRPSGWSTIIALHYLVHQREWAVGSCSLCPYCQVRRCMNGFHVHSFVRWDILFSPHHININSDCILQFGSFSFWEVYKSHAEGFKEESSGTF